MRGALPQEPSDKTTASVASVRPCPADSMNRNLRGKLKKKREGRWFERNSAYLPGGPKLPRWMSRTFFNPSCASKLGESAKKMSPRTPGVFIATWDKDELLRFSKEGPFAGRVNWKQGKALIQVRTRELEKGFTRVEVTARFRGYGQSVDRFAPPKIRGCWNPTARSRKTLISLWSRTSILSISAGLLNPRRRNG